MRTEDLRYLQLLERLRHGQCNHDDHELLTTRVVGQPTAGSLSNSPWNKVKLLFILKSSLLIFRLLSTYPRIPKRSADTSEQ